MTNAGPDDDLTHLSRWREGDPEAGRILFRRHFPLVQGFFAGKADDVEELTQRTFEALIKARHNLEVRTSVRAYILTVARHELYSWVRGRMRDPTRFAPDEVSIAALAPSPSQVMVGRAEQRLLLQALRAIPLDYQIIVELHYWDEVSTAELAEILEVPRNTVKTRLRKARQLLAEKLAALAETPALLQSTTSDLSRWARKIREQAELDASD